MQIDTKQRMRITQGVDTRMMDTRMMDTRTMDTRAAHAPKEKVQTLNLAGRSATLVSSGSRVELKLGGGRSIVGDKIAPFLRELKAQQGLKGGSTRGEAMLGLRGSKEGDDKASRYQKSLETVKKYELNEKRLTLQIAKLNEELSQKRPLLETTPDGLEKDELRGDIADLEADIARKERSLARTREGLAAARAEAETSKRTLPSDEALAIATVIDAQRAELMKALEDIEKLKGHIDTLFAEGNIELIKLMTAGVEDVLSGSGSGSAPSARDVHEAAKNLLKFRF